MHDLERQVEEFRSLFLTSQNIEKRRLSVRPLPFSPTLARARADALLFPLLQALPPRPVSPVKMMRPSSPSSTDSTLQERVLDLEDELSAVREERDSLSDRVAQLEADRLAAAETSTDARLAELTKENHELLVIARNADVEGELRRQERKFERTLERHKVYQEGLEATLEQERKVRLLLLPRVVLTMHSLTLSTLPARSASPSSSASSSSTSRRRPTSSPADGAPRPPTSRPQRPSRASSRSWPSRPTSTPSRPTLSSSTTCRCARSPSLSSRPSSRSVVDTSVF